MASNHGDCIFFCRFVTVQLAEIIYHCKRLSEMAPVRSIYLFNFKLPMTIIVVLRSFEREEPLYMTLAILRDTSDLDGL